MSIIISHQLIPRSGTVSDDFSEAALGRPRCIGFGTEQKEARQNCRGVSEGGQCELHSARIARSNQRQQQVGEVSIGASENSQRVHVGIL